MSERELQAGYRITGRPVKTPRGFEPTPVVIRYVCPVCAGAHPKAACPSAAEPERKRRRR